MSADGTYTVTSRLLFGIGLTLLGVSGLGFVNLGIWILLWPLALVLGGSHLIIQILIAVVEWCLNVALSPLGMARALPLALMIWGGALIWRVLSVDRRTAGDREQVHAR